MRIFRLSVIALLLTLIVGNSLSAQGKKPNFIIIVSDDQRDGTMKSYMPLTYEAIFKKGIEFNNAYITTPLCCPSRTSIMTGMYVSNHGVSGNPTPLKIPTMFNALSAGGYYTGLVGKYLNSWSGVKRPEFNYWVSFHEGSAEYYSPRLNVQGAWQRAKGYQTYLLRDYVLDYLDEAKQSSKPFALLFTPFAPHSPALPAPEDEDAEVEMPSAKDVPSLDETDLSDKPRWLRKLNKQSRHAKNKDRKKKFDDNLYMRQLRTLMSLDRSVAAIIKRVDDLGLMKDTVIFFISDNGLLLGEHGIYGKNVAYEESIHVPFGVRADGYISHPYVSSKLVANIDIAPTIYDMSGISHVGSLHPDGVSLQPLFAQMDPLGWRKSLLIETKAERKERRMSFKALVRDDGWVYIRNLSDRDELYDLNRDKFQMQNLINTKRNRPVKKSMSKELDELLTEIKQDK